jgi:hypothetical protein
MKEKYYRSAKTGKFTHSPEQKIKRIYSELYRAFDHFNKVFADNELPKPIITIQESGRRNALGWFGRGFWFDREMNGTVPEINLSAEYLARGCDGILETLLHEMAHYYNAVNDIRDCTSGQYHNKKFKIAAEKFGLKVSRSTNRGYSATTLTKDSRAAIDSLNVDTSLFKELRRRKVSSTREKKYLSLVVGIEIEDMLAEALSVTGESQKSFVENAISTAIERAIPHELSVV